MNPKTEKRISENSVRSKKRIVLLTDESTRTLDEKLSILLISTILSIN